MAEAAPVVFAMATVHERTTYELRQELLRRDAFERFFPKEDRACYDTLLKANVELLREDELQAEQVRFEKHNAEVASKQRHLAAEKEARKAEALARSAQRQADRQKAKEAGSEAAAAATTLS